MTSEDACAAGSIAIGAAYRYIRHGELDIAIADGTELLCESLPFLSFSALGLTNPDSTLDPAALCRPFDSDRHGFVLGEGSAFLILESAEHARARGAKPLARIVGFAKQSEAGSVLASTEDGSEFARCMQAALNDAGWTRTPSTTSMPTACPRCPTMPPKAAPSAGSSETARRPSRSPPIKPP